MWGTQSLRIFFRVFRKPPSYGGASRQTRCDALGWGERGVATQPLDRRQDRGLTCRGSFWRHGAVKHTTAHTGHAVRRTQTIKGAETRSRSSTVHLSGAVSADIMTVGTAWCIAAVSEGKEKGYTIILGDSIVHAVVKKVCRIRTLCPNDVA